MTSKRAPKPTKIGLTHTECRKTVLYHTCRECGEVIPPSLCFVRFETFQTNAFDSLGVHYPSRVDWRVASWAHLNCEPVEHTNET